MLLSVSLDGRGAGGDGATEGRHDARGDGRRPGRESERVANGDDGVADDEIVRVAEGHRCQTGRVVDANEGHVVNGIGSNECCGQRLGRSGARDGNRSAVHGGGNHVIVGDDEPVLRDDHSRALILFALTLHVD
jgi:hypothetical protein